MPAERKETERFGAGGLAAFENDYAPSLNDWVNELSFCRIVLNGAIDPQGNPKPVPTKESLEGAVRQALSTLEKSLSSHQRALDRQSRLRELLGLQDDSATVNGRVLENWPDDAVSKQLMYIGAALLGSAGVVSTIENALLHTTYTAVSILPLVAGAGMFLWGLAGLSWDQRRKWGFYSNRMRVLRASDPDWTLPPSPRWRPW